MNYEPGTYAIVPNIEEISGLSPVERSVYVALCSMSDGEGLCRSSLGELSNVAGCSIASVKRAVNALKADALIKRSSDGIQILLIIKEHAVVLSEEENDYIAKQVVATQKMRSHFKHKSLRRIYEKYQYRCVNCGDFRNLQIDHIKPLAKGGDNSDDNLQVLCRDCNLKKSDNYDN